MVSDMTFNKNSFSNSWEGPWGQEERCSLLSLALVRPPRFPFIPIIITTQTQAKQEKPAHYRVQETIRIKQVPLPAPFRPYPGPGYISCDKYPSWGFVSRVHIENVLPRSVS